MRRGENWEVVFFCLGGGGGVIAQFRLHRSSIESVYIDTKVNIEVTASVGLN